MSGLQIWVLHCGCNGPFKLFVRHTVKWTQKAWNHEAGSSD